METAVEKSEIIYKKPSVASWILSGVSHRGEIGTYEIISEMTESATQEKLISKYGLEIPNTDLIWKIATKAYELRNENSEASETLRQFLRLGFRKYPNTSTRIFYEPSGNDRIIHNYGTQEQYLINEEVVGPDNWADKIPDKKVLESLLGTQDVSQINQISQWINESNSYIWRFNSKPKERAERVAGFDASDDGLGLDCNGDPHLEYPAFRVFRVLNVD